MNYVYKYQSSLLLLLHAYETNYELCQNWERQKIPPAAPLHPHILNHINWHIRFFFLEIFTTAAAACKTNASLTARTTHTYLRATDNLFAFNQKPNVRARGEQNRTDKHSHIYIVYFFFIRLNTANICSLAHALALLAVVYINCVCVCAW